MDAADIDLRNATYRRFVELGRAPSATEVADVTLVSEMVDTSQQSDLDEGRG